MKARKLPLGISGFEKLIGEGYHYIDKTPFIKAVIDSPFEALLFPRPRRFGKTLNLNMLRCFFEKSDADRSGLFRSLAIRNDSHFEDHQGKYPVIWLTFKDVKHSRWEGCIRGLTAAVQKAYSLHRYLLESDCLFAEEKAYFEKILSPEPEYTACETALSRLSEYLHRCNEEKVVILIDEYDTPIHAAHEGGYYKQLIEFIRNFLSGGLKDNPHLFKGVLTGILRVAKESVFSGLNNLGTYTLLDRDFNTAFGFTEAEVTDLLHEHDMDDRNADVSAWYNGYLFGGAVIYNPWSVLQYVQRRPVYPSPYWVNTADSEMIERLATRGGRIIREEIGQLLEGDPITKPVYDAVVMGDLESRDDLLWSFLLFSGYLKPVEQLDFETWKLQIPNREIRVVYRNLVRRWFDETVETNRLEEMIRALEKGDVGGFEEMLSLIVLRVMSCHDLAGEPEKVYHALVAGMLVWMSDRYEIKSNRESGLGRFDLMLKPKDRNRQGIIIEFKRVDERHTPEKTLEAAMAQIDAKRYAAELEEAGIREVLKIAIAFKGKQLWTAHK